MAPKFGRPDDWRTPEGKFSEHFVGTLQATTDAISKLENLSSFLDAQFGDDQGSLLYRNATEWVTLAPGTSGQYLKTLGAAANPQWATLSQPVWVQIESRTVNGDEVFTDLGGYQEIICILKNVTASSLGNRQLQFSIDNGANFLTASGDYYSINLAADTTTVSLSSAFTTAIGASFRLTGLNQAGSKHLSTSLGTFFEIGTSSTINAFKIYNSAGTPNGGTIILLGIP